jgi:hypothetical protein
VTVINMQVALLTDFNHYELVSDHVFDCISYGDASYTLVEPKILIGELDSMGDEMIPLIEELKLVPDCVLVAVEG